ncbi:MAG: hypothetical protein ACJ76V_16535 [Thermoleophilaceae bacterium]
MAVHLIRGDSYWNYSEGVYAYTSRVLLHDGGLYRHVVVAQPPAQFLVGALVLAIHDSLGWLRLVLGLVQVGTAVLCSAVVWRLTGNRVASVLAAPLAMLTPWAVHENGQITPELFAPPLFLGAALLATRRDRSAAAGALAAAAPFFKVPFLLPLAALVLTAADRRRALTSAVVVLVAGAAIFTAIFGTGLWEDAVAAQIGSGRRGIGVLKGVWGQAGWNLIGLLVPAALALAYRTRSRDPLLLRIATALAIGFLLTLITNTKQGTGLNILVPIEAALVPLAVAGATWSLAAVRVRAVRARPALVASALGLALVSAQGLSLLASPTDAKPFLRPGSRPAWEQALSKREVDGEVSRAKACNSKLAYPGPPFIAFLAHRRMPDDQPDQFITEKASRYRDVLARMRSDKPFCPAALPPKVLGQPGIGR